MGAFSNVTAPFGLLRPVEVDPYRSAAEFGNLQAMAQLRQQRQQEMAAQQQAMQLQGVQLQEAQQDLQDRQTLRTVLPQMTQDPQYQTNGAPDWQKLVPALADKVGYKTWTGLQQTILKNQETLANTKKAQAEADNFTQQAAEKQRAAQEAWRQHLGNVAQDWIEQGSNGATLQGLLAHMSSDYGDTPDHRNLIGAFQQQIDQDPAAGPRIMGQLASGLTPEERGKRATAAGAQVKLAGEKRTQAAQELASLVDPQTGQVTDPAAYADWTQKHQDLKPPAQSSGAWNTAFIRSTITPEKLPEYDINQYKARMGLLGNSEYDQYLAQFARSKGKTPATLSPNEALQSFQSFAATKRDPVMQGMAIAMKQATMDNMAFQQGQRSYQFHAGELDKLSTPVAQLNTRLTNLNESIKEGTPISVALVAPELLSIMSGGQGSGLRMNQATLNDIVGGRSNWEALQTKINKWRLDPTKALDLSTEQVREVKALAGAATDRVNQKVDALNQARQSLVGSNDPMEHRRILGDVNQKLMGIDTAARQGAGGGAAPPLPAALSKSDIGKTYTNRAGQRIKITNVNPQNPKQFQSEIQQ